MEKNQIPKFLKKYDTGLLSDSYNSANKFYSGILRKDKKTPYLAHPVGVCEILINNGFTNEKQLSIALLHDSLEELPKNISNFDLEVTNRKLSIESLGDDLLSSILVLTRYDSNCFRNLNNFNNNQSIKKHNEIIYKNKITDSINSIKETKLADFTHNISDFKDGEYLKKETIKKKVVDSFTYYLDLIPEKNNLTQNYLKIMFNYLESQKFKNSFEGGLSLPKFNKQKKETLQEKLKIYEKKLEITDQGLILPQK